MTGLLLAISATILWSLNNILDKVLVHRFGANGGIRALVVVSALFPVLMLPICIMNGGDMRLPIWAILILLSSGVTQIIWIWLYMLALYREDVTIVMPLMALSPVAAWILGISLLSEVPHPLETAACAIIVIGAIVLTYEFQQRRLNALLLILGVSASAMAAATNAFFKFGAGSDDNYWAGLYWQSIGTVTFGILVFCCSRRSRTEVRNFLVDNAALGIGINATNESITLVGNALFSQAVLYGQIAVIQSMEALQPVFVFVMGAILTRLVPRYLTEDLTAKAMFKKILGITIICVGTLTLIVIPRMFKKILGITIICVGTLTLLLRTSQVPS